MNILELIQREKERIGNADLKEPYDIRIDPDVLQCVVAELKKYEFLKIEHEVSKLEVARLKAELRETILDLVWQNCIFDGKLNHMYISTYEGAFTELGFTNGMTVEQAQEVIKKHD